MSVKAFDPFSISVGKHELQVTLVDTPGYGESLDAQESFAVVEHYVDALFERQVSVRALPEHHLSTSPEHLLSTH